MFKKISTALAAMVALAASSYAQAPWASTVLDEIEDTVTNTIQPFIGDVIDLIVPLLAVGFGVVIAWWAYGKIKKGVSKSG